MFDVSKYEYELTFDKPIIYKDLIFFPVEMKDYFMFYYCIKCLTIDKDKIPNVRILSMGYLDFLFYLFENDIDGESYKSMFLTILKMCCNIDAESVEYIIDENDKVTIFINKTPYNKSDFDDIKSIICYQNMPDYKEEEYIDPDLQKAIDEMDKMTNKSKGFLSLESQIDSIQISTGFKRDYIESLTIRRFVRLLRRVDSKLHYQIYKTGELAGTEFKGEILHWMYDEDKNKLDGKVVDYDNFQNKINV